MQANGETMNSTRVMNGFTDLTGETCGTFKVKRMVARRPEPRYAVTCTKCGVGATATQTRLRNRAAICQYSGCGKTQKSRGGDLLAEQRQQAAKRESQRLADEQAASAARMDADTEGWERPTKYTPTPDPKPAMSAREVAERKERRAAEEAERKAADAPRLEAERKAAEKREAVDAAERKRGEKQRAYWADWVLTDADPKFVVTPTLASASMSQRQAAKNNLTAVEKFTESVSQYAPYRTPGNAAIIVDYLARNGALIYDASMLEAAFIRLKDLGVLTEKPMEAPQNEASDEVLMTPQKNAEPIGPTTYRGRDYLTGHDRDFTEREVNRMSSLEYQHAFQVAPTVSELFSQMDSIR